MGQGVFAYNTAATASNGNQYTAGYYYGARRCEKCTTPCISTVYYYHYWCYTDQVKKIYGDCIPDQESVDYCATLDGTGLYAPAQTFLHDQLLILANLHDIVDPGYKADGQLVQRPVVEFSDTFYRLRVRFKPSDGNSHQAAASCDYLQYEHTAGKFQATDTELALTGLSGYKACKVTFGIEAEYNTMLNSVDEGKRKYAVTCSFSKYYNCRYSSAGSAKCDALKTSACVRVCRAASSTCGTEGDDGECPATSDCAEDCTMDGRSGSFWCAVKVAGL